MHEAGLGEAGRKEKLERVVHQIDTNAAIRRAAHIPNTVSALEAKDSASGDRFIVVVRGQETEDKWLEAATWVIEKHRRYAALFFPTMDPKLQMRVVTLITNVAEMKEPDKDPDIHKAFEEFLAETR